MPGDGNGHGDGAGVEVGGDGRKAGHLFGAKHQPNRVRVINLKDRKGARN